MTTLRTLLLLVFALPAVFSENAQALPAGEFAASVPVEGEARTYQQRISVASDGHDYLVVWVDGRARSYDSIIAARVNASGELIDVQGLFVARGPIATAGVVWSGDAYTIVWATGGDLSQLRGVRVTREGSVGAARVLAAHGTFAGTGALASDGTRTVAGYQRADGNRALVLDAGLNVVADVALAPAARTPPLVSASRNGFVAAWTIVDPTSPVIEGVRLSPNGTLLDAAPVVLGSGSIRALAGDGENYLLLRRSGKEFGAVAVPADLQSASASRPLPDGDALDALTLFAAGGHYVAVGPRFSQGVLTLVAIPIDRTGVASAPVPLAVSGYFGAASSGDGFLLAWPRLLSPDDATRSHLLSRVYDAGPVAPRSAEQILSTTVVWQDEPGLATNGTVHLVRWREAGGLYAARIGADGTSLDGSGIILTREPSASGRSVIWDGREFLVSWTEKMASGAPAVVIRFVSASAGLLADSIVIEGVSGGSLANGPDGRTLVLTYDADQRVHVRNLNGAARSIDPSGVPVSPAGERADGATASWNGSAYLVAWSQLEIDNSWQFPMWMPARVRGARVSRERTVADTEPFTIADIPTSWDAATGIASDGTNWLVTWETSESDVRATQVLANATIGATLDLGTGFGSSVMFDGGAYRVAWKRGTAAAGQDLSERQPLTIARIAPATTFTGLSVLQPTDSFSTTAIAPGAVAYTRLATELGGVPRVFIRSTDGAMRRRAARH